MDYTQSDANVTDGGTGQRMHQSTAPITTEVSSDDMNAVNWELLELIKGADLVPAAFNKAVPATYAQVRDAVAILSRKQSAAIASATGTPDVLIGDFTPDVPALVNGLTVYLRAVAANATVAPTFTPNDGVIAAKEIVKGSNMALRAGDIAGAGHWLTLKYDLTLDKWVLKNPALGVGILALLAGTAGASLSGYMPGGVGAVGTTAEGKLRESVSVRDKGALGNGSDATEAFQAALTESGTIRVTAGSYVISADLLYYSDLLLIIDKKAVVTFNGCRLTPATDSVNDVAIIVNGMLKSENLPTNPAQKFTWPANTGGAGPTTTYERGFIEFGGASTAARNSGFYLGGTGKVRGDWAGTPSTATLWTGDIPRKGIASWFSDNVLVEGVTVNGFHGEAVYHYDNTAGEVLNVVFQKLYVHDTNFNGLNFNIIGEARTCHIRDNNTKTTFQGVELSAGHCDRNVLKNSIGDAITFGAGYVGTIWASRNTIDTAGANGIHAISYVGNPGTGIAYLNDNDIFNVTQGGVIARALNKVYAKRNTVSGYATIATDPYGIYASSTVGYAELHNNTLIGPGASITAPVRSAAAKGSVRDNLMYDTGAGGLAMLVRIQSMFSPTVQTPPEYKLTDGVGALGVGNSTVHRNGSYPSVSAPEANYVKLTATVGAVGATGALGNYVIATRKATADTTTLGDTCVFEADGSVHPGADNAQTLGTSASRWSTVYAGTGAINTSDAREKQQIRTLSDAEHAVAVRCKSALRAFKFNDAVSAKGDAARIHFGVMAQDVQAAFESEGLTAESYAIFCYDEWTELPEIKDGEGYVVQQYRSAGNRFGVRYDELLAFIIAAL